MDSSRLAKGIRVSNQRRGHGDAGGKICRREVCQPIAYSPPECMDPRARRVLEFPVPILYLEKPARVTVTVGNTIFGAYTGEREVDWVLVIWDVVKRLLTGVGKSKPTPICPYLLHLYIVHDVVQADDKRVYMVGESFMRHEVDPDEEEESSDSESSERESLTSKEIREFQ